ncbi:hypothetical protein D9M73_185880 [compost metagenome]
MPQAQHGAERRIERAEMPLQIPRRLGQRIARVELGATRIVPFLARAQQDGGERLPAMLAIEIPVPPLEQRLCLYQLRIAMRIDAGDVAIPARRPAHAADAGIIFDAPQIVGADRGMRAHQLDRARAAIGGVGLDAEQR